jgi:3-deoxy-D-manno-octulosonic-acid transferase
MRRLYSLLLYLLTPLVLAYLFIRGLRDSAYLARWAERFAAFAPPERRGGIVVHAVSMGEVNAASALVRELGLHFPDLPLCVTAFTPTGSARVRALFGDRVFHVYSPLDLPGTVRRFFKRLKPRLLIVMETEIWPNLFHQAAQRGIPLVMANARISDGSLDRYRRFGKLTASTLENASRIAAQSERDAERLVAIGAPAGRITVTGNLKFDLSVPPSLSEEGKSIRAGWGTNRLALVAGSTHEADEQALLAAFGALLNEYPQSLLVLVPRHPERFERAARLAQAAGLETHLLSQGSPCPPAARCLVIDRMGELLRYYAAGDIAFVGGTIASIGGHNVLEPAALARPLLFGPHTANVAEISDQLLERGAALRVCDAGDVEAALRRLFDQAELRDRMGRAALALVRDGQGALNRTLAIVEELLTEEAG